MMAKKIKKQESYEKINQVISSGKAAEKFNEMVHALGGPIDFLDKYNSHLSPSSFVGFVTIIHAFILFSKCSPAHHLLNNLNNLFSKILKIFIFFAK